MSDVFADLIGDLENTPDLCIESIRATKPQRTNTETYLSSIESFKLSGALKAKLDMLVNITDLKTRLLIPDVKINSTTAMEMFEVLPAIFKASDKAKLTSGSSSRNTSTMTGFIDRSIKELESYVTEYDQKRCDFEELISEKKRDGLLDRLSNFLIIFSERYSSKLEKIKLTQYLLPFNGEYVNIADKSLLDICQIPDYDIEYSKFRNKLSSVFNKLLNNKDYDILKDIINYGREYKTLYEFIEVLSRLPTLIRNSIEIIKESKTYSSVIMYHDYTRDYTALESLIKLDYIIESSSKLFNDIDDVLEILN